MRGVSGTAKKKHHIRMSPAGDKVGRRPDTAGRPDIRLTLLDHYHGTLHISRSRIGRLVTSDLSRGCSSVVERLLSMHEA